MNHDSNHLQKLVLVVGILTGVSPSWASDRTALDSGQARNVRLLRHAVRCGQDLLAGKRLDKVVYDSLVVSAAKQVRRNVLGRYREAFKRREAAWTQLGLSRSGRNLAVVIDHKPTSSLTGKATHLGTARLDAALVAAEPQATPIGMGVHLQNRTVVALSDGLHVTRDKADTDRFEEALPDLDEKVLTSALQRGIQAVAAQETSEARAAKISLELASQMVQYAKRAEGQKAVHAVQPTGVFGGAFIDVTHSKGETTLIWLASIDGRPGKVTRFQTLPERDAVAQIAKILLLEPAKGLDARFFVLNQSEAVELAEIKIQMRQYDLFDHQVGASLVLDSKQ